MTAASNDQDGDNPLKAIFRTIRAKCENYERDTLISLLIS